MRQTEKTATTGIENGNIISFHEFRRKKAEEEYLSRGRRPLYVSHGRGQVRGQESDLSDFGGRIAHLRSSIDSIYSLVNDLKKFEKGNSGS